MLSQEKTTTEKEKRHMVLTTKTLKLNLGLTRLTLPPPLIQILRWILYALIKQIEFFSCHYLQGLIFGN